VTAVETIIHLLGIPGSLRAGSYNRALLRAAGELLPSGIELEIFPLDEIPLYNADVQAQGDPVSVEAFKRRIAVADALLIATPEYN
jgi:chromate reductase